MTVTEDMDPAEADKYVFKRFRWRLPEVLVELYFVATKEGKIKTLKEAKKWVNEQERVDTPQVAAKRWKAIKLQHDGRELRLRDWGDFQGQYTLFRRNVEDWNEDDEQARLLSVLPEAWIKRVTKEEAKIAKSNHTVKMMRPKEYHRNVVAWTKKHVAPDVKPHSLRNALLITLTGDHEKTAMWRLDECELGRQTICLQAILARMTCDEVLEWVGEDVLEEYRNLHDTCRLKPGDRDVTYVGEESGREAARDPAGAEGGEALDDDDDDDEPAETAVCAFVANNLNAESNRGSCKPRLPPGVTLPQLQRQRDAWRVIQEGGDGAQAELRASHGGAERGTGGDRGSAQERAHGAGQGTRGREQGRSCGGGQSAGSGPRDSGQGAGKGPGHGKGVQGRGQGAQVQGAGRGTVGERAGQGVGDKGQDPRHGQGAGRGPKGKGKGATGPKGQTGRGMGGRGGGRAEERGAGGGRPRSRTCSR